MVNVYFFKKFDVTSGKFHNSNRPATLEAIARARGEAFMESAIRIDASELDGDGFRRKAKSSDSA